MSGLKSENDSEKEEKNDKYSKFSSRINIIISKTKLLVETHFLAIYDLRIQILLR